MWGAFAAIAGAALNSSRAAPAAPAVSGGFNGQMLDLSNHGIPAWNRTQGGNGQPPQAQAFRPDSLVMGLTGLSTTTNAAVGNGTAVTQPAAITNSLLHNNFMWIALAVAVVGVAWIKK